jgi:opacity protein-like surface antigen
MRRLFLAAMFVAVLAPAAFAQNNSDDYHKVEVYGGYSYGRFEPNSGTEFITEGTDSFNFEPCTAEGADFLGSDLQRIFCERRGFNGFDASVTYNVTRYVGIKGNITGHFKNDTTVDQFDGGTRTDTNKFTDRTFNFLAGLQIKDNSKEAKVKPFAHVLAGVARQTSHDVQTSTAGFNFTLDDRVTSFAMKFGGGIDVRVSPRVDLRIVEVNYNPIFTRDRDVAGNADFGLRLAGRRADNLTIGFGVVFH